MRRCVPGRGHTSDLPIQALSYSQHMVTVCAQYNRVGDRLPCFPSPCMFLCQHSHYLCLWPFAQFRPQSIRNVQRTHVRAHCRASVCVTYMGRTAAGATSYDAPKPVATCLLRCRKPKMHLFLSSPSTRKLLFFPSRPHALLVLLSLIF